MKTKIFEVRNSQAVAVYVAVELKGAESGAAASFRESALLEWVGIPAVQGPVILLGPLTGGHFETDAAHHLLPIRQKAHRYIQENWHSLESGALIDLDLIRGDTEIPKESVV